MHAPRSVAVIPLLLAAITAAHAQSPQLEVVGSLKLRKGIGEFAVHKNLAAIPIPSLGGISSSLELVDLSDPAQPRVASALRHPHNAGYSAPRLLTVDTPGFKGDLLAVGYVSYSASGGFSGEAGVQFWDVSTPSQPRQLGRVPTLGGARSLDVFRRDDRLIAILAVNDDEMWLLDVTDFSRPVLLSLWVSSAGTVRGVTHLNETRTVRASRDGMRAYTTHGDAGAYVWDLTDLAKPRLLGRTSYGREDEGNAFDIADAADGRVLVTSDWDWDATPAGVSLRILNPNTIRSRTPYTAIEPGFTRQLATSGPIRGEVVYVGSARQGVPLLVDPRGKIALVDTATVFINGNTVDPQLQAEQARRLAEAGATAVLFGGFVNRWSEQPERATIPGISIETGLSEMMQREIAQGLKVEVEFAAGPATFGFLRLWDSTAARRQEFSQISTFALPTARSSASRLSLEGDRLYASWFEDGVRVIDLRDPAQPREIGHFVPPGGAPTSIIKAVTQNGLIFATDWYGDLRVLRDVAR